MSVAQPVGRPTPRRRHRTTLAGVGLLAGLLVASPGPVAAREPAADGGPAPRPVPGAAPSQMYEDAMEHAADRIRFVPGDRVTVPFRPRASDRWAVGGEAPRALPAGRRSGRDMAGLPDDDVMSQAPVADPTPTPAPEIAPVPDPAGVADPSPTPTPDGTPVPDPAGEALPSPDPGMPPIDAPVDETAPLPAEGVAFWPAPARVPSAPALPAGLRREVYGFLPYWEVADDSTRLRYEVLSHIAYFSVGAQADGDLLKRDADGTLTTGWGGWTSQRMTRVINDSHARGTRVTLTISVFAWTSGQLARQKALLGSATARANLARQAVAAVRDRGADGINLDFEPLASGYEDEFVALVRTIRAELNRVGRGYHLSFDALGYPGNYPLEAALAAGGADAVVIMGYDYRTAGARYAGSIDPLSGPAYDLTETVERYLARVPASKVILGIPYYGRAWSTVSDARNARTQTGAKYGYSTAVTYDKAVAVAADYGRRWDSREQSAWVAYQRQSCTSAYGCVTTWRQLYYDDPTSLKLRYDLVNRARLRGVGIWALGYDGTRTDLAAALAAKFLDDTTAPLAGIVALAATQRDVGFVVRWRASEDLSGIASYDVDVSADGGPWTRWLSATRATSDVYLGSDGVGYAFRARARDGEGNVSPWNVTAGFDPTPALAGGGFGRVVADTLNMRSDPDLSASRVATLAAGDVVAVTGGLVSADGYAWYQVSGPLDEWGTIGFVRSDVWVAASGGGTTLLRPVGGPHTTRVQAGIREVAFNGGGAASIGSAGASWRAVSPNGDGSGDRLRIDWNNRRDFETIELRVLRSDGTRLDAVALPDRAAGPQQAGWSGRVGDAPLPDGTYLLQLVATDAGTAYRWPSAAPATRAQVAAVGVVVDTVPPALSAAAISGSRISPDGDGRLDTLAFSGSATGGAARWELLVAPVAGGTVGAPVRRIAGTGARASVTWNGRDDAGTPVGDGAYRLTLRFLDAAGNAVGRSFAVRVDATDPVPGVSATPAAFSPDGDGAADTTRLRWTSSEAVSGTLRLSRGSTTIRRWTIGGTGGGVTWTGRDTAGRVVGDGPVLVTVSVSDASGNRATASTRVVVDRTAGYLRARPSAFFPQDGDALARTTGVSFRLARTATTRLRVLDATGAVVRTAWSSRTLGPGTPSWTWNGRLASGAMAPRGRYTLELTATGSLGTTVLRRAVVLDAFVATPSATTVAAGQTLAVRFRSAEPLARTPRASFTQSGRAAVAMTVTRLADGSYRATVRVAAGAPGPAKVTMSGVDVAGGRNTTSLVITVR